MMTRFLFILLFFSAVPIASSQYGPDYYLPVDIMYNPAIPGPVQFIGHEAGEWHVTHDRLYYYMLELARLSDRAVWEEYGRSYENRALGHLIVSSPENIKNLEQIRRLHVQLCDPERSEGLDIKKMPVFIKLGYGVHGNESSAQNASLLAAYYLVAGEGKKIDELLSNAVILIDPALNPDGLQRHSGWVNFTKSLNNNPDVNSWEFSESWPGGRTNHYWFDLNRDYIMLQHPETRGRVSAFHRWKPNINTDHHEMEANATFFFQPGVPTRNNPLTPEAINALTAEISRYHERFLNKIGSLYYSEEGYDDFYVGKGSSYPDIHGSVGILFEQAGPKGHLRETPSGMLSFPFAIRNQVTVTLSTLEAGLAMKDKLLDYQRKFYRDVISLADRHPVKAYVFSDPADHVRTAEFLNILLQHQVRVYRLSRDISKSGMDFRSGDSYIIPLKQNEHLFIRSLFEPVKKFTDSLFYDISTWVLPLSFNIPYTEISVMKEMTGLVGTEVTEIPRIEGSITGISGAYAYLFDWNGYFAPKALYMIQNAGLKVRVATREFTIDEGNIRRNFSYGTIMVPVIDQPLKDGDLSGFLGRVAKECGIMIHGVNTGLTPKGMDLGSNLFMVLKKPSVMMFVGEGINSSDAGEIWHLFDVRLGMPVTMIQGSRMGSTDLDRYNVMIVAGSPDINQAGIEKIREWNRDGGTIIAYKSGNNWLARNKLAEIEFVKEPDTGKSESRYIDQAADRAPMLIPGTIFETKLDLTHPLCYGFNSTVLPVIKTSQSAAVREKDIYRNPITYSGDPLLSGYCTGQNLERIRNTAFCSVHGSRIISIYDNTNFRAVWYGTNKVFLNAVFFGQIIR